MLGLAYGECQVCNLFLYCLMSSSVFVFKAMGIILNFRVDSLAVKDWLKALRRLWNLRRRKDYFFRRRVQTSRLLV